MFGMNMKFISTNEAKTIYFIIDAATNELYTFSSYDMK